MNEFMVVVQRVLHSVLCSRVLLHIRSAYHAQNRQHVVPSMPTMVIAQFTEHLNDSLRPCDQPESQHADTDYSTPDNEMDAVIHKYPPGS
ncbi:hypothetical protein BD410DRAFT_785019 [Rickenella mellea]|uniref:Uncharacterized protein n=1 Tax=Rickenella mellea TaxID=50990 RepID=A0A4Y7QCU6_9AGAM|nr:hypothetical protein BD410DRAFT_785019 [Rickenella mellea]